MTTYKIFSKHIEMTFDTTDVVYSSNEDSSFIFQMLATDLYKLSFLYGYGREYRSLSQLVDLYRFSTLGIDDKCEMLHTLVSLFNISSNPLFEIEVF